MEPLERSLFPPSDYTPSVEGRTDKEQRRLYTRAVVIGSIATIAMTGIIQYNANPGVEVNVHALLNRTPLNNELGQLASNVLETPTFVDCNNETLKIVLKDGSHPKTTTVLGAVFRISEGYAPPIITLNESVCDTLATPPKDINALDKEAFNYSKSLYVLLHEGEHTKQVFSESIASCYAIQKLPAALQKLGATAEKALTYARITSTSQTSLQPEAYQTDDCYDGGPLDLNLDGTFVGLNEWPFGK